MKDEPEKAPSYSSFILSPSFPCPQSNTSSDGYDGRWLSVGIGAGREPLWATRGAKETHPRTNRFRTIAWIPRPRRLDTLTRRGSEGRWPRPARDNAGPLAGESGWYGHERGPLVVYFLPVALRASIADEKPRYGPTETLPGIGYDSVLLNQEEESISLIRSPSSRCLY
jgi:hypothetical protein